MRPKRLELQGFASFRDRAVVDFEDAPLFVLTGPTGAGKSSLVDAITFALYGSVPRYEDRRLVAPVITQGQLEARVRLDFSIGGEEFTAVRVVRREKKGGAATKEARLEKGSEVLAGNESELSEKVEGLIGLSFEHFTKCVVLPQGEFAQFLRDKPRDRQALLVKLLDIGVYGTMAKLARTRHQRAAELAALNLERLNEDFGHATPESRRQLKQRLARMEELSHRIEKAHPTLIQLAEQSQQASQRAAEVADNLQKLQRLRIPKAISQLGAQLARLGQEEEGLRERLAEATTRLERLEAEIAALPDKVEIAQLKDAHKQLQILSRRSAAEDESRQKLVAAEAERGENLEAATRVLNRAQEECERVRDAHAAAHLAAGLEKGRACPVCAQPVTKIPEIEPPRDLKAAEADLGKTVKRVSEAEKQHRLAREELRVQTAQWERTREAAAQLERQLQQKPSIEELDRWMGRWHELESAQVQIRSQEKEIRELELQLRIRRRELETASTQAQADFHAARAGLLVLQPPAIEGPSDLVQAWSELTEWASVQIPSQQDQLATATEQAEKLNLEREAQEGALQLACREAGLEPDDRPLATLATEALLAARGEYRQMVDDLGKAKELRSRVKKLKDESRLAKEMSALLGSRGFERWYLNRAMCQLVAGASQILRELSSSQYSLSLDEKGADFLVVDHNSADERRLARTLSGGETFLASLSLALALSEHVASLSARGAARLEAIFLDEGFGTLDPETLETVAAAIDELGEQGRMVGLITHVRELADRIPVRYQVSKDAHTSSVEKTLQ